MPAIVQAGVVRRGRLVSEVRLLEQIGRLAITSSQALFMWLVQHLLLEEVVCFITDYAQARVMIVGILCGTTDQVVGVSDELRHRVERFGRVMRMAVDVFVWSGLP